MKKVNVRQTSHEICDIFENLLYKHNIMIPDEDREGEEGEACIYGSTYSDLEDQVTEILANILNETKKPDIELETYSYNFTECINGVYYVEEETKEEK